MLAFRGVYMKFNKLIDLYNSSEIDLATLLHMIGKEVGQDISYNACYWFSEDIKKKNKSIKPITLANLENTFCFIGGKDTLFSIYRKPYNKLNSNESLLRTSVFPNTDETGSVYDIHNDQYQLGLYGLYEKDDLLFNKYKYITFIGKHKINYEAYVDKNKGTIMKVFYDKYGDPKSKYFYNFTKKYGDTDDISYASSKVAKTLDEDFPEIKGELYKQTYADLIDQYFYDIKLMDIKNEYKDLFITNKTQFVIPSKDSDVVSGFSIIGEDDKNKESYIALSNPNVSNLKLLCVTDFVNGYKLNKNVSRYITSQFKEWFYDLDRKCLKDEELLLSSLGDKILDINKNITDEINLYRKKNKKKEEEKVIGSALGLSLITKDNTYFFNYGDTRIYSTLDDELSRLTIDDTKVWDYYKQGYYTYEEACAYQKKSLLTNYIGNTETYLQLPELYSIKNDKYDKLFILSDGVTDNLEESTISNIIKVNDGSDALSTLVAHACKHRRRSENATGCCYIKK